VENSYGVIIAYRKVLVK